MAPVRTNLSGATQSTGIPVISTSGVGETVHVHRAMYAGSVLDEIHLFAYNSHTSAVELTLNWGGTTAPDNTIKVSLQAGTFLKVIDGLHISGGLKVSAFADAIQRVILYGYALSHTA